MGGQMGGKIGGKIYPKIYPKIYGRFYGNPTTHLGGEIPEIGRNRDGSYNFDIGFVRWHISESAVPSGNLDDLGGGRVRGLAGGLAGCRGS